MATDWAISAGAERVALDDRNRGELTFTVTNLGSAAEWAVLEPVPGDGADRSWFTVEEPRQLVRPGSSAGFLMRTAIPPGTPAGSYFVQGRVYGADGVPEEGSRLSDRVALEVTPVTAPKRRAWWPYAVAAALVVVVAVVVGLLVFGGDDPPPVAGAATPDVTNRSFAEAEQVLAANGLTVGQLTEVADAARQNGTVVDQQPPAGTPVRSDGSVDLTVVANPTPEPPVTVAVAGDGVVSGNGLACPGTCTATVAVGTQVRLTATVGSGNTFGGWGGQCAGVTGTTCEFKMPATAVAVSATFKLVPSPPPPDPNPEVPNVVSLSPAAASSVLRNAGFEVSQVSAIDPTCNSLGEVMRQNPEGGTRAARGSRVTITVGAPPQPPRVCP